MLGAVVVDPAVSRWSGTKGQDSMRFRSVARLVGQITLAAWTWGAATALVEAQSANLKMGNPSGATTDVAMRDNYLLDRPYFATSYNNSKGTPNWVSWRLAKEDIGKAPRDNFYADTDLPTGFLEVEPSEYNGSGFDRGHMCPHGDRTATDAASLATFDMINIIPQSHNLNTMAWEALESYCRDLVLKFGKTCYILDGPSGQGGTGKNGLKETTPDGKIVVPSQNWKVIMVLDHDVATAQDLTSSSQILLIAAIMANNDTQVGMSFSGALTTVNEVEALTGYTFFSAVDPAVINPLKGQRMPLAAPNPIAPVRGNIDFIASRPDPAPNAPAKPAMPAPATPDSPTITALKEAVAGLEYPSEANEPFQVVDLGVVPGPFTDARLWNLTGQDPRARLERVPLDPFFRRLTHPKRPLGQVSLEQAKRFAALLKTIQADLTDVEVIKFGQSEVALYIIGRTRDGHIVAIRTAATET